MLNPNKLGAMIRSRFIPVTSFTGRVVLFEVQSSGAIGSSMEVGLSANTNSATFEGGTGITALRTLTTTSPAKLGSASVSQPEISELSSLGLSGCLMNTAGMRIDTLGQYWLNEMDLRHPIQASVLWSNDSTTITDTVTWKLFSADIIPNSTTLAALSEVVAFTADNVLGTAKQVHETGRKTLATTVDKTATLLHLGVEMDAKVGITEDIWLLGLMLHYTERRGRGLQKLARRFARSQD
jgi:hypothetical protein